jgi:hypothetical protein
LLRQTFEGGKLGESRRVTCCRNLAANEEDFWFEPLRFLEFDGSTVELKDFMTESKSLVLDFKMTSTTITSDLALYSTSTRPVFVTVASPQAASPPHSTP